jgi:hypothetical protein
VASESSAGHRHLRAQPTCRRRGIGGSARHDLEHQPLGRPPEEAGSLRPANRARAPVGTGPRHAHRQCLRLCALSSPCVDHLSPGGPYLADCLIEAVLDVRVDEHRWRLLFRSSTSVSVHVVLSVRQDLVVKSSCKRTSMSAPVEPGSGRTCSRDLDDTGPDYGRKRDGFSPIKTSRPDHGAQPAATTTGTDDEIASEPLPPLARVRRCRRRSGRSKGASRDECAYHGPCQS